MTRYLPIAALGTLVAVAMGVGLWHGLRQSWLEGRAASAEAQRDASRWRDEPAPWPDEVYLTLSVITCTRCKPGPDGICTCGIACPHPACMFDHAVLTGPSQDEIDFLDGKRGLPL